MKRAADIRGVVKRQKMYSTLARHEGEYALKKEHEEKKEGAPEMAKDSAREANVAFQFAKKRKKIAGLEEKKLKQKKEKTKKKN
jgi:hypothetical protein